MVLCGVSFVDEVFKAISPKIKTNWRANDGDNLSSGDIVLDISGPEACILTGERIALNFLQTLSATATETSKLVSLLEGTNVKLLDTRKTIPLWRAAQKYAVTCGGGLNHRMGLYDAFLIKENHILSCGSITLAVTKAKESSKLPIIVEVENFLQLKEALDLDLDRVMLDNFSVVDCDKAVKLTNGRVPLEVSGNITIDNIRQYAMTGVDFISSGSTTKNIHAIDLSMRLSEMSYV
jgi:nicotinate-nucleotide pyrophosphorylase (carboxylating)